MLARVSALGMAVADNANHCCAQNFERAAGAGQYSIGYALSSKVVKFNAITTFCGIVQMNQL